MALNTLKRTINIKVLLDGSRANSNTSGEPQFRVLNLRKVKVRSETRRRVRKVETAPPRTLQMPTDQNWGNVWPGPKSFHPAVVPLPIRQGYNSKEAPPSKYGNAELMKIPNFLHLTPPVIKRQCEALKKFCTPWPKELASNKECEKYFPLKVTKSSYCYSSPSIRNPLARIVSLRIKLSHLSLDEHAKDKFLRLVGDRYDEQSDYVTIVADRCPTSKQNYDYAMYLLTALFHESWNKENWEASKSAEDMEYYDWNKSPSRESIEKMFDSSCDNINGGKEYAEATSHLINGGENLQSVQSYGNAVRKILNLPEGIA